MKLNFDNLNVAVVDDNPFKLKLVRKITEKYNVKIDEYIDGESLIEKLIKEPNFYDLLFIDWQLGKNRMDGFEVITKIKNLDTLEEIKGVRSKTTIVLFTNYIEEIDTMRSINIADYYMPKYIDKIVL